MTSTTQRTTKRSTSRRKKPSANDEPETVDSHAQALWGGTVTLLFIWWFFPTVAWWIWVAGGILVIQAALVLATWSSTPVRKRTRIFVDLGWWGILGLLLFWRP